MDPRQLENALLNLAVNARDAMPSGGRITIETRNVLLDEEYTDAIDGLDTGEYVRIEVTDTGTGIPKEFQDRVFEPFFTTKDVEAGTGLGLSMVYGFARQSGGHAAIYSEAGHGTTVALYIPRAPSGEAGERIQKQGRVVEPTGNETILLVEDLPQLRKRGAQMLAGLGYSVIQAENGREALAELETAGWVDLLFTDIVMPGGMNGFELAEFARKYQPGIKVLYTSGYAEGVETGVGVTDAGAPRLRKPYSHRDLAHTLRRVFESP